MRAGKWGCLAIVICFGLIDGTRAADLVFKNGETLRDVEIVTRSDDSISVRVSLGVVRYPLTAVKTIDGRPVNPAAAPTPGVMVMAESEIPAPSALAPTPALQAAPSTATKTKEPPAPDRWNFEWFLLGFLLAAGLWMRGLQKMQQHLFERKVEPRYWMVVGLLLPVIGVGAYFATQWAREKTAGAKPGKSREDSTSARPSAAAAASGTGLPFPRGAPSEADPVTHQGHTRKGLIFLDSDRHSAANKDGGELVSGLDYASELLEEALLEKASDIHIEPTSDLYRVRFRLDGILHERMSYPPADGIRVVTALKSLAQIDIAEKRKAQDGKFRVTSDGREVDFRAATASSIYGEKIVIRVLDHRGGIYDLTSLGMPPEMIAQFQRILNSRSGMILATGPTGSGKTSTLYAALRQLNGSSLNIMTIEDPVEYELAGATQMAVNPRANVTYEAGLRSILRQDPDVILVGEMRDTEATAVALRAALTGHLVFSSLHTKDAVSTVSRLQDMGIERYQVASALLMVLGQRLVRVLCPDCRREYSAVGNELEAVGLSFEPGSPLWAAQGCDGCQGTGFRGRTGIFELLVLDDEFRRGFSEGLDEAALTKLAVERGFRNCRYDGAEKVLMGITTVEEVLRAS